MRIAVAGKGWLALRAARLLETLVAAQVVSARLEVVRNRDDTGADTWLPSLARLAAAKGWPVHARAEDAGLGPRDVLLSLQHDRIVDCAAIGGARAYNLHFAHLPKYRGSLTSTLPIRYGETAVGVSLHIMTQQVDAGPVIATRPFELPRFYTAYDLYRAYHSHGFELLNAHLRAIVNGTCRATPQDDSAATVFTRGAVDFSDAAVGDFDRCADEVANHCRSLVFPPIQYPTVRGRPVRACYTIRWPDTDARRPGAVVSEDGDQIVVACRDGWVCFEFADTGQNAAWRGDGGTT